MRYFIDTEFCEGFKKPIKWLPTIGKFNKPYHAIELISIGIVCEDGRTYYAISSEFDIDWAWDKFQINENRQKEYWLRENVLRAIYKERLADERYAREYHWGLVEPFCKRTLKNLIRWRSRTNYQIACDILEFTMDPDGTGLDKWLGFTDDYFKALRKHGSNIESPEFYTFYGDYDHVVFCSLFGTMMDLPKSFPMYSHDLKQTLDEKALELQPESKDTSWLSLCQDYPKQNSVEHHALNDAKFNFELYKFLNTLTTKQKISYA